MPSPRIALVTAAAARDLDDDLAPLIQALQAAGANVSVVDWDDARVDWSGFDAAILRSTWDYTTRLTEFLHWADRTAAATRLLNPAEVVRWNTDKHYLAELANAGVGVVPSAFIEPRHSAQKRLDEFFLQFPVGDGNGEFVVKPCVGAGSRDAQRYGREERDAAVTHIQRLLAAERSVVLQPYLARVDEHGETALVFIDGELSHAIRKGPLLRRGDAPTRALFAAEHIAARDPSAAERRLAELTLAALQFPQPLLYARVDLIHDAAGSPLVLELELSEPSLFFAHGDGSAERFAAAIVARVQPVRTTSPAATAPAR